MKTVFLVAGGAPHINTPVVFETEELAHAWIDKVSEFASVGLCVFRVFEVPYHEAVS